MSTQPDPAAREIVERTRSAQGLSDRVIDPAVLDAVVAIVTCGASAEEWLADRARERRYGSSAA